MALWGENGDGLVYGVTQEGLIEKGCAYSGLKEWPGPASSSLVPPMEKTSGGVV